MLNSPTSQIAIPPIPKSSLCSSPHQYSTSPLETNQSLNISSTYSLSELKTNIIASSCGALLTSLLITPLDLVKNRLQAHSVYRPSNPPINPPITISTTSITPSSPLPSSITNSSSTTTPSLQLYNSQHNHNGSSASSFRSYIKQPSKSKYESTLMQNEFYNKNLGMYDYWCPKCELSPSVCPIQPKILQFHSKPAASTPLHLNGGILDTILTIAKYEGISRLWSGLTPSLLMSIPNAVVYFSTYQLFRENILQHQQNIENKYASLSSQASQLSLYSNQFSPSSSSTMMSSSGSSHNAQHIPFIDRIFLNNQYIAPLLAGTSARLIATVFVTPFELLRTRAQTHSIHFQHASDPPSSSHTSTTSLSSSTLSKTTLSQTNNTVPSMRSTLTQILSENSSAGVRNLFQGMGPTLARDITFSAIYWVGIDILKAHFDKKLPQHFSFSSSSSSSLQPVTQFSTSQLESQSQPEYQKLQELQEQQEQELQHTRKQVRTWFISFLAGALAGVTAGFFTHPFDIVKTRKQMTVFNLPGSSFGDTANLSLFSTLRKIVTEDGLRALSVGLAPRLFKIMPSCAIMLSSYDAVRYAFNNSAKSPSTSKKLTV